MMSRRRILRQLAETVVLATVFFGAVIFGTRPAQAHYIEVVICAGWASLAASSVGWSLSRLVAWVSGRRRFPGNAAPGRER